MIRFSESFRVMIVFRRSIIILIGASTVAFAQKSDTSRVCWRPRPLAKCNGWIITETGVEMPTTSTAERHFFGTYESVNEDFPTRLAFTLGGMVNRGPHQAVGVTVSMLNGDLPGRIEGRYRRWLGPDMGLDVSTGAMRAMIRGEDGSNTIPIHGLTGSVGLSGPHIGADARFDLARSRGRTVGATYLTVRTGGHTAAIVTAIGFAAFVGLLFLAFQGDDS